MLTINLHYVRALLNPYLLGEVCLHDDTNVKEALNKVLQKTTHTPIAYGLDFRDFANVVKIWGPFFDTPLMKDLNLLPHEWWDWLELVGAHLHPSLVTFCHKCVHIIVRVELKFLVICP